MASKFCNSSCITPVTGEILRRWFFGVSTIEVAGVGAGSCVSPGHGKLQESWNLRDDPASRYNPKRYLDIVADCVGTLLEFHSPNQTLPRRYAGDMIRLTCHIESYYNVITIAMGHDYINNIISPCQSIRRRAHLHENHLRMYDSFPNTSINSIKFCL